MDHLAEEEISPDATARELTSVVAKIVEAEDEGQDRQDE